MSFNVYFVTYSYVGLWNPFLSASLQVFVYPSWCLKVQQTTKESQRALAGFPLPKDNIHFNVDKERS